MINEVDVEMIQILDLIGKSFKNNFDEYVKKQRKGWIK